MMWIPLRSPKIYSFIFGFQRRGWWAKRTPASSNSFIVISTAKFPPQEIDVCKPRTGVRHPEIRDRTSFTGGLQVEPTPGCRLLAGREFCPSRKAGRTRTLELALAELEALAGALLPVLLAFLHA